MATYHLNHSYGSRQGGQSARAKLAYVLRCGRYARGRDDLVAFDWGHLPDWCGGDPFPLFAAADRYERANGRLYIELEGALPVELDLEESIGLTRGMADAVTARGLPFVWAIHAGRPPAPGAPRNRHFHFVSLERISDGVPRDAALWFRRANMRNPAAGGAPKERSLKGHEWLPNVRRRFERLVNEALERAGRPERVTAASHRDRIVRAEAAGDHETAEHLRRHPPGRHVGPAACAIERGRRGRPGRSTERGDLARARDDEAARLRAELERIEREREEHLRAAVAAARDAGVDEALVAAAQPGEPDTVLALDDATELRRHEIRDAARAAGFDDDEIERIRKAAAPSEADTGWGAVAAEARRWAARKEKAEAEAREAGILDIEAVYAAARSQSKDPLATLEEATAARRRTEREARLRDLQRRPGGREIAIAHLAAVVPAGHEPSEEQIDAALTAAESDAPRLARAGRVHGARWSRLYYVAAAGAFGERFTLEEFHLTLTGAESFHKRARELSRAGRAVLEAAVEECGEHPAVAELVAALERAQEAERREEKRRREEARRRGQVAGRERNVRATKHGPAWLSEATERVLQGADRPPTLDERERVVAFVEGWVRQDLDRRLRALLAAEHGARFLEDARRRASDVRTLAAEEQVVDAADARLREHQAAEERRRVEQAERKRRAEERHAALTPAGRELYEARLTDLVPAGRRAGAPSMSAVEQALDETEADGRLSRLEAVLHDPEQLSYYRSQRGAPPPDRSTLEQVETALTATESFARRKQTVFGYRGGTSEHPDGAALYAAARESRSPGWRPGAEIGSAVLDAAVAEVESRLAERVRQAADEAEKLVRTRRPYPVVRPGFRVPPLDDDLLGKLLEADDDAFQRATVVEVGERYRRRAGHDVPRGDRYDGRARRDAQQTLLEDAGAMERCSADRPEWSVVLAAVLEKYLSKLREYFRVACDKVLGGDLGERLAAHRAQVRQAADAAETLLRPTSPPGPDPAVPGVSDETLAVAADGTSVPFIKELVVEVGERYKRREVEGRYTHLERRRAERGHLQDTIDRRMRSRPRSSARSAVEAEVFAEHRRRVLEVFEVACDEVVGHGELGARLRKHREQVQRVADSVEQAMVRQRVSSCSEETLAAVRAGADSFLKEVVDVVREREDRRTPKGERYDDVARRRREAEEDCLAPLIERELEGRREAWRASTRRAARERAVRVYRSRIISIFTAARDEAFRSASPPPVPERQPSGEAQAPAAAPSRPLDDREPARRSGRTNPARGADRTGAGRAAERSG